MPKSNEFVDYVVDQLQDLGKVYAKRMFGAHGLYCGSLMFGLIDDDTLYLKADDQNCARFEDQDLGRFTYTAKGREVALSYYQAPPDALDDPAQMLDWARSACDAARRGAKAKVKK